MDTPETSTPAPESTTPAPTPEAMAQELERLSDRVGEMITRAEQQRKEEEKAASEEKRGAFLRDWGPWLLAIGPASAFLLGFAYEVGFASARGLPTDIVTVRPESIAWGIGALGVGLVFLNFLLSVAFFFLPDADDVGGADKFAGLMMIVLGVLLAMLHSGEWFGATVAIVVGVGYLIQGFVRSGMAAKAKAKAESDTEKPKAEKRKVGRTPHPVVARYREVYTRAAVLIAPILVFGVIVWVKGKADALAEEMFLVHTDDTIGEMVVLRSYGDFAIAAKLDRAAKKIGPGYKVIALDGLEKGATRERLGLLTTAEPVDATNDAATEPAGTTGE